MPSRPSTDTERFAARIVGRRALHYADGACDEDDRPAFVRAASGVIQVGDDLCVLQDDASFIAVVGRDGSVRAISLPRGPGGRRRFEEALGNRLDKLDLECGVALPAAGGDVLLAFGSGSLPVREVAVLVDPRLATDAPVVDATRFYASFREALGIARATVNVEGCVIAGDRLRVFQRGPRAASVDFELAALEAWVRRGASGDAPRAVATRSYELGRAGHVGYGFSDAAALPDGRVVFLAVAEDTDDPVLDGAVLGSIVGVIDGDRVSTTPLLSSNDEFVMDKAEGIAVDPARPGRLWVTLDPDDPERPADLCEVEVLGL